MALKVFERHLAREIYSTTAMVLVAFLLLFAFFDFIGEIQNLGRGGYELYHAALYVLLTLPGRAYELIPIAVLIGTLYALTLLARHSEITVLRTSGLSTRDFLRTFIKLGTLFVILTFLIGEYVAPPFERMAQQMRLMAMSSMIAQEFRSGLWVKDEHSFVNIRDVEPDSTLRGVRFYEFDDQYRLRSITEAERGGYSASRELWQLNSVVRTVFDGTRARVETLAETTWKSSLTPDLLSVMLVVPEKMSLINLYLYVRHLAENQQKTDRYVIAIWKKLIYPLSALVMMILALPFGYLQSRMGSASVKVFVGIMLGIAFHLLNSLFSSLGVINSWTPFWSAITPSAMFLSGAFGMLWWVERR
jgi:lipopolysaccharide export system permease protein